MSQIIEALAAPEKYRESRAHLFPSPQSLVWFIRRNREELVAKGALLVLAGRNHVDPFKFDEVVIEVGQRAAGKVAA